MAYAAINGLTMYYEVHGDGPPLLLLHGGGGSIREKWIPFFSSDFRVIAPEQMGHGRTADLVDRPFHYHDMAEDTVELMRVLEIENSTRSLSPSKAESTSTTPDMRQGSYTENLTLPVR